MFLLLLGAGAVYIAMGDAHEALILLGFVPIAVAPRGPELQLHLPGGVELHTFVRQRLSGDVATQLLELVAVVRFLPHRRVQAKPVDVGAQRLARHGLARDRAAQGPSPLP
jgi:hypothetical protein